ncbi:MAG: DUF3394 domain-containing protein [Rubrivivax sp.]|nr:DUF3394 domain-containing protein [Rubrivivax sp.]
MIAGWGCAPVACTRCSCRRRGASRGEDAIKTGVQGAVYALRTVILPFIWIFNPALLLVDVRSGLDLTLVVLASTVAMLVFAALTMNWMRIKLARWEFAVLVVAVLLLFRPDAFMDRFTPEYRDLPAAQLLPVAKDTETDDRVVLVIGGTTIEGEDVVKTVAVQLAGKKGDDGRKRLVDAGLTEMSLGDKVQIGAVKFGSRAKKAGLEQGWEVKAVKQRTERPSEHWFYLPALLLVGLVWVTQGRRMKARAQ